MLALYLSVAGASSPASPLTFLRVLMSDHDKRRPGRRSLNGQSLLARAPCAPDDGIGPYTREQLTRMDADFIAAMERVVAAGKESRQAAAAMNGANASRPR